MNDRELIEELIAEMKENGTTGPDAERCFERAIEVLEEIASGLTKYPKSHDGYIVEKDSCGEFIRANACPSSCELNGCNGHCKVYI